MPKLIKDGYGQLELNQVAFRRDGRIEAQCFLDATDFANIPAENGMILAVDKLNKAIKFSKTGDNLPVALNYTTEHMYDERKEGLKHFSLDRGTFLPRMGYLSVGDRFTTNTCEYGNDGQATINGEVGSAEFDTALAAAVKAGLYGVPGENGYIALVTSVPTTGVVLQAVQATTMPDGQPALKFNVYRA